MSMQIATSGGRQGAAPVPAESPGWPALPVPAAAAIALAWTAVVAAVAVLAHPTPLYTVETDLVGEYLPAARQLLAGVVDPAHYAFKGPGYPLLLAVLAGFLRGDVLAAARLLSPVAAGAAAWLAYLLSRRAANAAVATFVLLAMLASPVLVRHALQSGTDTPALALMLASTLLVLSGAGIGAGAAAGLLAGLAVLTRGNALFLVPCAALVLLASRRAPAFAAYAAGVAVPLALWNGIVSLHGGLPPDRNYLNVAWELYGRGVPWDQFQSTVGPRFRSMRDVFSYDPGRAAVHVARNLLAYRWLDARELVTLAPGVLAFPGLLVLARSERGRPWVLHGLACALVLAPVFYNARFALYLLPLYLAGAGESLVWLAALGERAAGAVAASGAPARAAATLAALAIVTATGWSAIAGSRDDLRDAPAKPMRASRTSRGSPG